MKKDSIIYLAAVEITQNCNLFCKHCYGFFKQNKVISLKDFERVLYQLHSLGTKILTITGGEPMMVGKKICDYIKTAKKFFKFINLTSNGTLINEKNVNYLRNASHVQISIDGPERIHDYIRGRGTFKKAFEALKILKKANINCSIMMTVSDYNIDFINEVRQFSLKLGVKLGFERITNVGRGKEFNQLNLRSTKKLIKFIHKFNLETTDPLSIVYNRSKRNYLLRNKIFSGCSAGCTAITIDTDLNVLPCSRLRIKLGNLNEEKLKDILDESSIVKKLKNRNLLTGKCGKCRFKFICGGCRAMSYAINNNYLDSDPGCFI